MTNSFLYHNEVDYNNDKWSALSYLICKTRNYLFAQSAIEKKKERKKRGKSHLLVGSWNL